MSPADEAEIHAFLYRFQRAALLYLMYRRLGKLLERRAYGR